MIKVLVTDGCSADALTSLRNVGFEVTERFYSPEELGAALKDYDCVVIRSATKVRKAHMDTALETGRLKLIVRGGVGLDNIDTAYAEAHGIAVRNTPCASSNSVAELALAHMLSCSRFLAASARTMAEGRWEKKAYSKGTELRGKTLGIVGYGHIGSALGGLARALGMKVLAYRRHVPKDPAGVEYVDLDTLLSRSDYVSIHTPAVPGKPLMDGENIAKMKDGAVLINTSRGANVDEAALLAALDSGKLRGAGLDVWETEPTANEALYRHPRVSATPHIGAATQEAQDRVGAEVVDIITDFFGVQSSV